MAATEPPSLREQAEMDDADNSEKSVNEENGEVSEDQSQNKHSRHKKRSINTEVNIRNINIPQKKIGIKNTNISISIRSTNGKKLSRLPTKKACPLQKELSLMI